DPSGLAGRRAAGQDRPARRRGHGEPARARLAALHRAGPAPPRGGIPDPGADGHVTLHPAREAARVTTAGVWSGPAGPDDFLTWLQSRAPSRLEAGRRWPSPRR